MSKFRINVCLPPSAGVDLEAALQAAMAPFDINLSADYNPDGMWDWWRIDAGEGERFAVKPEHDGDPRLIHCDPDEIIGYQREPLRCDGGPRGLLDFDASRREAYLQALTRWEARQRDFERLVADHPSARPLTDAEYTRPGFETMADWAITATALLTLDGQWVEPEQMGPFTDLRDGEGAGDSYARQSTAYIEGLDDDCIVVRLSCHC